MQTKYLFVLSAVLMCINPIASASYDSTNDFYHHQLSVQTGSTNIDKSGDHPISSAGMASQIGYNYQFNNNFSLDTALYVKGDAFVAGILSVMCLSSSMDYESIEGGLVGVKLQGWVGQLFSIYLKGGATYATIETTRKTNIQKNEYKYSGFGHYAASGFDWFFINSFGLNMEYNISYLPGNYKTDAVMLGITYRR